MRPPGLRQPHCEGCRSEKETLSGSVARRAEGIGAGLPLEFLTSAPADLYGRRRVEGISPSDAAVILAWTGSRPGEPAAATVGEFR